MVQLRHIHDYIAQDSPLYAKRVSDALVRKTFLLDELPRLGRKVPELGEENVRELSLYSYRILYEIKTTHIDILAAFTRDGICRGRFRESRSAARKPKSDFDFIAVFASLHYLEKCQDSRRESILFCSLHHSGGIPFGGVRLSLYFSASDMNHINR